MKRLEISKEEIPGQFLRFVITRNTRCQPLQFTFHTNFTCVHLFCICVGFHGNIFGQGYTLNYDI